VQLPLRPLDDKQDTKPGEGRGKGVREGKKDAGGEREERRRDEGGGEGGEGGEGGKREKHKRIYVCA
jgi:hypothetical protein